MAPTNEERRRAAAWQVMLDYVRTLPSIRAQYQFPEPADDDTPKKPRRLRIGTVHTRKMRKVGGAA